MLSGITENGVITARDSWCRLCCLALLPERFEVASKEYVSPPTCRRAYLYETLRLKKRCLDTVGGPLLHGGSLLLIMFLELGYAGLELQAQRRS